MRYEDKARGWWVEIQGAADMPLSALRDLYEGLAVAAPIMARVVKAHNLIDWDGRPVNLARVVERAAVEMGSDGEKHTVVVQSPEPNVSRPQLQFIRKSVAAAVNDEELDPEA